jgi:hypothetical protein
MGQSLLACNFRKFASGVGVISCRALRDHVQFRYSTLDVLRCTLVRDGVRCKLRTRHKPLLSHTKRDCRLGRREKK